MPDKVAPACDVVVLGGGIAGLWILDRLRVSGYAAVLLERAALGCGQTLAAQGIIHGGRKYVGGYNALAEMPARWRAALENKGGPDLSQARMLSPDMLYRVPGRIGARVVAGATRHALHSDTQPVPMAQWPGWLSGATDGTLFRIGEPVLDVASVLAALSEQHQEAIGRMPPAPLEWRDGLLACGRVALRPGMIVAAAGAGNEELRAVFGADDLPTQRRPLRQILIAGMREPVYAHCVDGGVKPLATVTSHPDGNGGFTWYVGGAIAEDGASVSAEKAIAAAKERLPRLFPGADFANARWSELLIDRAEYGGAKGDLPDDAVVVERGPVVFAWPSKLALAPRLADKVLDIVAARLSPASTRVPSEALAELARPSLARPPWQGAL